MSEKGEAQSVVLDPRHVEHRRVWLKKPALRVLYTDYHSRLTAACPDGPLLDIGGGTAHIKQVRRDILSVDIYLSQASMPSATRIAWLSPTGNSPAW
jgi:hypothetical protein